MDIQFRTEKLAKECNSAKLLQRTQGEARAKVIRRRLDALRAAVVLSDLRNTPGRLHELKGDRKGQFSFDLDGRIASSLRPTTSQFPHAPRAE